MPIPSVVIEPASSNEGDDDRGDIDIVSPIASSGDGVTPDDQMDTDISTSGMPPGFLYKVKNSNSNLTVYVDPENKKVIYSFFSLQVETMHDFEAANSDELDLKKGDIVLVVPTELVEDQV